MRIYLDCSMGASGDMLMAALYELLPDKWAFREKMERLGLPGVTIEYADSIKCGIKGTHITIKVCGKEEISEDTNEQFTIPASHAHNHNHNHNHNHTHDHEYVHDHNQYPLSPDPCPLSPVSALGFDEILEMIRKLDLPEKVIDDSLGVYKIIGEAEAAVHGSSLDTVHLHEIGALDAVTDIVGCSLLINMLGVNDITSSPVHVGSGFVKCEHGILPVPAPAAAEILKGIPIYGGRIKGELCTPTGAALLKRFVTQFGEMPPMTVVRIGYGMGTKDFAAANCVRALLSEDDAHDEGGRAGVMRDTVYEISCNLDDMTPEAIGASLGLLFSNGALDVYTTPISMKKNRPAVMLSCICAEKDRDELAELILRHTSTLGVRICKYYRKVLSRTVATVPTEYGDIRVKRAEGYGIVKYKPEYNDVLAAAHRHAVPFTTVHEAVSGKQGDGKQGDGSSA